MNDYRTFPFGMWKGKEIKLMGYENPQYLHWALEEAGMVKRDLYLQEAIRSALRSANNLNKGKYGANKSRIKETSPYTEAKTIEQE